MGIISERTLQIDFAGIRAASHAAAESLVRRWLPGGRREGPEYVVLNPTRGDERLGSFKVNLEKGVWADFATDHTGADLIDLYHYLFSVDLASAAKEVAAQLGVPAFVTSPRTKAVSESPPTASGSTAVVRTVSAEESTRDPAALPARTPQDANGRPRFSANPDGPKVEPNEKRRHIYKLGSTPVKIKIMLRGGDAVCWYCVSHEGKIGWQPQKPIGFQDAPYIGSHCPFDPERTEEPIFWPEGEKDVDTLTRLGALAATFGGTGDGLPAGCEGVFRNRHVIILADNDEPGVRHAEKKAALATPVAATVKVLHFTDIPHKEDVSWFIDNGGTLEQLEKLAAAAAPYAASSEPNSPEIARPRLAATPYIWVEPEALPRREFLYGTHLIRKFVSATVAPGGVGKSSLKVVEALASVSGKPLLGVTPSGRLRVWLWNLEDPREEIQRSVQASALQYGLFPSDVQDWLFVDSGRDQRLVIAVADGKSTIILEPIIDALVEEMKRRKIDILVVDPFISSHEVAENDNPAMDRILKAWGKVAERTNAAIELVHHSRKSTAGEIEITVESSRGAKAITDGCRSVRVLNRMSKQEAEKAGVDENRRYFRAYNDKANLAPPAEHSDWFELKSVNLGNGPNGHGDSVGVVVKWSWPNPMADVNVRDLRAVQAAVSKGRYRWHHSADDWVGKVIAEVLHLDTVKQKHKILSLINAWIDSGALKKVEENDGKGNLRPYMVVGEWAND